MKKIIVTPAGRKQFLEILYNNLYAVRDQFDEWILWANTDNKEDLDYIRHLSESNDFIRCIDLDVPYNGNFSIASFFKYAKDVNSVYLRLDDDICFVDKSAIENIFNYRISNPEPFLVYGNIVNNAIINYIQQRSGRLSYSSGANTYAGLEYIKRNTEAIAAETHRFFIDKINLSRVADVKFDYSWKLLSYERASINAVAWLGSDFDSFDGIPDFSGQKDEDEEEFLACTMPKRLKRPNEIYGNAVFAHFSYRPQLDYLINSHPEIYDFYLNHSKNKTGVIKY